MSIELEARPDLGRLEQNRLKAISALEQAVLSSQESRLREDQISVVSSSLEFLKSGEHAGYFDIATGVGKTAVAIDIARKLGLKTLILTNTRFALMQNMGETGKFAPEVITTDYHAKNKDLSGQIVHMTYQSALNFFVKGKMGKNSGFDPNSFDIIFCDEADLGIGQKTYEIYRVFPHALKVAMTATPEFSAIDRLIARGIVQEDEEWVGMFRNNIHTYDLEEAQERGTLVPADIHFLKTNTQVGDIKIESNGEYNQSDLERYLTTEARNELVIAMLLGSGKLNQNVRISSEQRIELEKIYQKIKGKRAAVFGISINHIKDLAKRLAKEALPAAVMYGETSDDQRTEINRKYAEGEIQVVLGVDMLARAWNSPAIEVIIDMQPNYSGRRLKQKFGRGLRLSPETGKEKLIAIQLIDQFVKKGQSPVLFSDLYDPEFVLSGANINIGKASSENGHPKSERKLTVSFSGMDIQTIVEEARTRDLIKTRFKKGSIQETADFFEKLVQERLSENPEMGNYELFKKILADLPSRIPIEAQEKAIQALASMDTNIKNVGQKAFLLLNMKSILTVVDSFLIEGVDSPEDREEMLSVGIDAVALKLPNIRMNRGGGAGIAQQVYVAAKRAIAEFIARKNNLPLGLINDLADRQFVIERMREAFGDGNLLTQDDMKKLADEFSSQTGANKKEVLNWLMLLSTRRETEDDSLSEIVSKTLLKEDMEKVLDTLHDREKRVLEVRFGLGYRTPRTLEEVGREFGIGRERIRQIEQKALRKLRHPSRSKKLIAYLDKEADYPIAFPEPEHSSGFIGYEKPRTTQELQDMRKRNIFDIRNLSINRIEMDRLESCGIIEIGDFLTAPMEEIEQEWRTEFNNDHDLKNVVGEVILRINILQNDPKFSAKLTEHISSSVIYRDKEKAFSDLNSHEREALEMKLKLRGRDISREEATKYKALPFVYDWIAKIAEEKIFKKAYEELKSYSKYAVEYLPGEREDFEKEESEDKSKFNTWGDFWDD